MIQKFLCFALFFASLIALCVFVHWPAYATQNGHIQNKPIQTTTAKQAYIVDFETGQILMDKDGTARMPTSSMSKVMTIYMVFDALKNGNITLTDKFKASKKAWAKGGSKMFVKEGAHIKISDLIQGVIVQSGNDATIVLAEGLMGSEEKFAAAMTNKARQIGMTQSNFMNASGWPDPDHYSTAKDLTLLARRMIDDFPEYYRYYAQAEFTYSGIKQANRNPLLYRDIGADGLKTGHTEAGGYGLMGTAKNLKNGRRVIMVINGMDSEKERATEGTRLMKWALDGFINKTLFKKGDIISTLPVTLGREKEISLTVHQDLRVTLPASLAQMDEQAAREKIDFKITPLTDPLIAPIKSGDEIAQLTITMPHSGLLPVTVPLIAAGDIAELGFIGKNFFYFKEWLNGLMDGVF